MHNRDKNFLSGIFFRALMSSVVIIFGLLVMIIPVFKTGVSSNTANGSIPGIVWLILILLLLPSILYSIITLKTKKTEYVIIPALLILAAEYYFFNNFSVWISSDPNAAIALIVIPFYLFLVLGFSYGIAFLVSKTRKHV